MQLLLLGYCFFKVTLVANCVCLKVVLHKTEICEKEQPQTQTYHKSGPTEEQSKLFFMASTYFAKFWLTNLVSKRTVDTALVKQMSVDMFQLLFPFSFKQQTNE